jgi:hypothetical protein
VDIEIKPTLEIGGVEHRVLHGAEVDTYLAGHNLMGEWQKGQATVKLRSDLAPSQTTETFLHEVFHGINEAYCGGNLTEDEVNGMAQGAAQLLCQYGIQFVLPKR